ncbi:hypothetical protein [Planktothricoides raciborskii]|uniref:Uncharacterized protein n=1 Tax=Planktothricoides raciborskii FACHB-1370 TaxID=2949576 RepID=A0ABR8ECE0_9CYAN|nr:hypothetical protein [Planktothricoides raciborskii]MBD2544519.1 hypothetical protein [Planktothricoides raciborskii FACHB-1370]MBD2585226.1 hypothetical protein [Planktothricoides raciborskii FACHB-1261]
MTIDNGANKVEIQSSIKGLTGGGNIKQEWIQTLVQAKQQNQLTQEQLEKIFEDLGANSGSVSANIVRLLTLRAIILPKTLPDYLQYLDIQKPDQNPNQQQQISLEFQSQIRSYRNLLDSFLSEGAISVADLICYHKRMEYVPAVAWLFDGGQPGLWLKHQEYFVSKVQEYFKRFSSPRKEYAPLEKLFKEWGYQLYISSYPSSPKGGTRSTGSASSEKSENISIIEWLQSNIGEVIFQGLFLGIFLIYVVFQEPNHAHVLIYAIASGLIRVFLNKKQIDNALKVVGVLFTILITIMALRALMVNNYVVNNLGTESNNEPSRVKVNPDPVSQEPKADNNFEQTRAAIKKVVEDLKKTNDQVSKDIVIAALQETLGMGIDIQQYQNVIEAGSNVEQQNQWIAAIKSYQTNKGIEQKDGYITQPSPTEPSPTDTQLRKDIPNSSIFKFSTITKLALDQIVNEANNKEQTVQKIQNVLNVKKLDYEKAMQGDPVEIKKLVEAIKEYQQSKQLSKADGIIDQGGDTYNKLKEDLAKN